MKKLAILPVLVGSLMFTMAGDRVEAAVVYCKTVGVPKGCVARPTVAPTPAVRRGAVNRGGPVNRVGVR